MAGGASEITLNSASNLEGVRLIGKMSRVSIGESRTPTDKHGKTNPAWDHTMRFPMMGNFNTMLVLKLYCTRNLGDRFIGEVEELYARSGGGPGGGEFSYVFG